MRHTVLIAVAALIVPATVTISSAITKGLKAAQASEFSAAQKKAQGQAPARTQETKQQQLKTAPGTGPSRPSGKKWGDIELK